MLVPGTNAISAHDIVDDQGFICGLWPVGGHEWIKWTSEVTMLEYSEMTVWNNDDIPKNKQAKVQATPMRKRQAGPSEHDGGDDCKEGMPPNVCDIVINAIAYDNSAKFKVKLDTAMQCRQGCM